MLYTRLIFWKCFPNIPFCLKKFSYNQSQTAQDNRGILSANMYIMLHPPPTTKKNQYVPPDNMIYYI